ncbi:MAG TPA: hypothetical protein VIA18_05780 [Polyangia bacterium]|nr:hypothetical protein [Polyangia bacterium]
MKRLISILAIVTASAVWIGVSACNTAIIPTPTRSFDRPSDVALTCVQWDTAQTPATYEVRTLTDCNPDVAASHSLTGDMGLPTSPTLGPNPNATFLVAVTAQSARGEVAMADTVQNKLIDLDPLKPGFGFLPVGDLPEHIRTSSDGCFAYTANTGSCDFGRVDINQAINHSQRVEITGGQGDLSYDDLAEGATRIKPWIAMPDGSKRYLQARPSWIEMAPDFDGKNAVHGYETNRSDTNVPVPGVCYGGIHKAWVAYPNCQLVAKIDFEGPQPIDMNTGKPGNFPLTFDASAAGRIEQAIQVTRTGASIISDLTTINCAAECTTPGATGDMALPPPVDAAVADAGTGIPIPTTQAAPTTLSVDTGDAPTTGGRIIIGDAYGERLDIIPISAPTTDPGEPLVDPTANLGAPHYVQLETGALGVTVVRTSPRSPAGKFVYAIARDGTVRVVDLDRELECETNIDPRFSGGGIDLQQTPNSTPTPLSLDPLPLARRLGCFPVNDPNDPVKPRRNSKARSPGITLSTGQLPTDVAFVHVTLPPGQTDTSIAPLPAAPGLLVGDFAWIISSDGRAEVVQIFDDCPQPNQQNLNTTAGPYPYGVCDLRNVPISVSQTEAQYGHPEALLYDRVSHRLRNGHPRFELPLSFSDTTGMARIADETQPYGVALPSTSQGDGGAGDAGIAAGLPAFYADNVPAYLINENIASADVVQTRIVKFVSPDDALNESWVAQWEGVIPGTDRSLGHPFVDTDNIGKLTDSGGAWCSRGVLAGDKLRITGCASDSDCNQAQVKSFGDLGYGHGDLGGVGPVGGPNGFNNFRCVTDPNAPADVFDGLCLVVDNIHDDNYWSDTCGELLRSQRKYRITHARQNQSLDNGEGITDVLQVAEIYEPEYAEQTHVCAKTADCADITVPSADGSTVLPSQCLTDWDGVNRCLIGCSADTGKLCGQDFECLTAQNTGDERCMRAPINKTLWQTCFPELLEYQIQTGDSFLMTGTVTPFLSDETTDANGECVVPPVTGISETSEYIRLHNSRIPLTPANACTSTDPLDSIDVTKLPGDNVCSITQVGSRILHFENGAFNTALQVPTQGFSTNLLVPPDGTTVTMTFVGGGARLFANLAIDVQAQQPRYATVSPDGQTVYIIDEGEASTATGLRGQIFRLFTPTQTVDPLFQVR